MTRTVCHSSGHCEVERITIRNDTAHLCSCQGRGGKAPSGSNGNDQSPPGVSPPLCHAYMQAVGMVNDHLVACCRHRELGGRAR
ncbi:MAG: DNA-3-methyladenine glycosylase I [Candidatus Eisenbacteria bacterium]